MYRSSIVYDNDFIAMKKLDTFRKRQTVAYLLFTLVSAKQTQAPVSTPSKPGNPGGGHETK